MFSELTGVVACGGFSSRMGTDKSFLNYHGKPQCYFLYDLLKCFCKNVLLSCTDTQYSSFDKAYQIISDKNEFKDHGPISGLLSAFSDNPGSSIFLIGCDYPFLNTEELQLLISQRNDGSSAVSFLNEKNFFEPLITIYENKSYIPLLKQFQKNIFSLQEFLRNSKVVAVKPENFQSIKSIDTQEEYQNAILSINKKKLDK
jgi:molybdopterin-guanine dinucleotide biosynthesis protein A